MPSGSELEDSPLFKSFDALLKAREGKDRYWRCVCSAQLITMGEPRLFPFAEVESYRLLYLRSFDPAISVRVLQRGPLTYAVVTKMMTRPEGGELMVDQRRPISSEQWEEFQGLLVEMQFWSRPIGFVESLEETLGKIIVVDGSQSILEGNHQNRYQVIGAQSSYHQTRDVFVRVALYLLSLGRIEIPAYKLY
jgi:hypothetical protein